ncbi:hypothetical protein GUJ93_ZPchr0013g37818 [Zizania palustris]|uniref:Pentatricopeptide repeat-containing protein n=1 Tax=Zizania palustris TaxID=103762 RepID=A0A8J5WSG4_ZIZPA|nr:hypothetical protein GUJ93_ZPchr0013g37818 [Zizania palustris]
MEEGEEVQHCSYSGGQTPKPLQRPNLQRCPLTGPPSPFWGRICSPASEAPSPKPQRRGEPPSGGWRQQAGADEARDGEKVGPSAEKRLDLVRDGGKSAGRTTKAQAATGRRYAMSSGHHHAASLGPGNVGLGMLWRLPLGKRRAGIAHVGSKSYRGRSLMAIAAARRNLLRGLWTAASSSVGVKADNGTLLSRLVSEPECHVKVLELKLEKLIKEGIHDCEPYSVIIRLCGETRNVTFAMRVFGCVEELGIQLNTGIFNALIDAFLSVGDLLGAVTLYETMEGIEDCKPNSATYDAFICAFSWLGSGHAMMSWYLAAKDAGFTPSIKAFESLITGFVRLNRLDDADMTFEEMNFFGIKPNFAILDVKLELLSRRKDPNWRRKKNKPEPSPAMAIPETSRVIKGPRRRPSAGEFQEFVHQSITNTSYILEFFGYPLLIPNPVTNWYQSQICPPCLPRLRVRERKQRLREMISARGWTSWKNWYAALLEISATSSNSSKVSG